MLEEKLINQLPCRRDTDHGCHEDDSCEPLLLNENAARRCADLMQAAAHRDRGYTRCIAARNNTG